MKYINKLEDLLDHSKEFKNFDIYVYDSSKFIDDYEKYLGGNERFIIVDNTTILWKNFGHNRDVWFSDLKIYLNLDLLNLDYYNRSVCII